MKIGNIKIKNPLVLAPMNAINCRAFRVLCKEYGAGLIYTAMIEVDRFLEYCNQDPTKAINKFLDFDNKESPITIQLIGRNTENLIKAGHIIEDYADIIDLNMGCILGDVLGRKEGAYFVKHPENIKKIYGPFVKAMTKPVTAKIRTGWDNKSINAVEVATILEEIGIKAIAVHGRTRKQRYTGRADWEIIKEVKDNVSIPVIGNGDISKPGQAKFYLERKYCDAVMIGRAVKNNPFLFQQSLEAINNNQITKFTKVEYVQMINRFRYLYTTQKVQRDGELKDHINWFKKAQYSNK